MFFQAFTSNGPTPLPPRLTFAVEHQASQVLVAAETAFIETAVKRDSLPHDLFWEVEFFGSIPRQEREQVLAYFQAHKQSLHATALRILNEPHNPAIRDEIVKPIRFPDDF